MRQIRRSGLATLMVTGGALALSAGYAHADSAAEGAAVGSPGVGSGNAVQLPVHVPVNVCGNTVNVVGALNPAAGNRCANGSGGSEAAGGGSHKDQPGTSRAGTGQGGHGGQSGSGTNAAGANDGGTHGGGSNGGSSNGGGATADGIAKGSPGVLSGNLIQLPVHLPVNVSGNSVNVVGIGNPAFGNTSTNGTDTPEPPVEPTAPGKPGKPAPGKNVAEPPAHAPHADSVALAETGADIAGYGIPASAALLLGGAMLYRRSRSAGTRA